MFGCLRNATTLSPYSTVADGGGGGGGGGGDGGSGGGGGGGGGVGSRAVVADWGEAKGL